MGSSGPSNGERDLMSWRGRHGGQMGKEKAWRKGLRAGGSLRMTVLVMANSACARKMAV